ncbi:MAG: hypothetical protein MHMPM18_000599 [Marteilia pararefringens]
MDERIQSKDSMHLLKDLPPNSSIQFRMISNKYGELRSGENCRYYKVSFYRIDEVESKLLKSLILNQSENFEEEILQNIYKDLEFGSCFELKLHKTPLVFIDAQNESSDYKIRICIERIDSNETETSGNLNKLELELIMYCLFVSNGYECFSADKLVEIKRNLKMIASTNTSEYESRVEQIVSLCDFCATNLANCLVGAENSKEITDISCYLDESLEVSERICMELIQSAYRKNDMELAEKLCKKYAKLNPDSRQALKFLSDIHVAKYRRKMKNEIGTDRISKTKETARNPTNIPISTQSYQLIGKTPLKYFALLFLFLAIIIIVIFKY